jgi:hypothetical protein
MGLCSDVVGSHGNGGGVQDMEASEGIGGTKQIIIDTNNFTSMRELKSLPSLRILPKDFLENQDVFLSQVSNLVLEIKT